MHRTAVQSLMRQYITAKSQEIIAAKPDNQKYLEYEDMQTLASYIEEIWRVKCGEVPMEITAITNFACAPLEPDKLRKNKTIRYILSGGLGVSGILANLTAFGIGGNDSVWEKIYEYFCGSSNAGSIGLATAGSLAIVLAGYLMFSNGNKVKASDKALDLLRDGVSNVITDSMWDKYKDKWKE